jgi:hypothetical protein
MPLQPQSGVPAYAPPASGPAARLLVRVNHVGGLYSVSAFEQPVACSHRRQFVASTAREPESQAFTLAANKLQTLSFTHLRADKRGCEVIVSFEPRAGNTYLMRNTATAEGCSVQLFNTSNADAPVVERTRIRREKVGFGRIDDACKPLTSTIPRPAAGANGRDPGKPDDALEPFMQFLPGN